MSAVTAPLHMRVPLLHFLENFYTSSETQLLSFPLDYISGPHLHWVLLWPGIYQCQSIESIVSGSTFSRS